MIWWQLIHRLLCLLITCCHDRSHRDTVLNEIRGIMNSWLNGFLLFKGRATGDIILIGRWGPKMKDTLWIVCERTRPSTPSECDGEQRVNEQQDHMFSAQVKHSRVSKHERETFWWATVNLSRSCLCTAALHCGTRAWETCRERVYYYHSRLYVLSFLLNRRIKGFSL